MNDLVEIGLTNALLATALAVAAALAGRMCRRPALSHALWLMVLLKLLTPPLVVIPVHWSPESAEASAAKPLPAPPDVVVGKVPPEEPAPSADKGQDQATPALPELVPAAPDLSPPPPAPLPLMPLVETPVALALAPESPAWSAADVAWLQLIGAIWMGGAAVWFAVATARIWRFQRLLGLSRPAPVELQRETAALAARFGLRDCPRVWLMPGIWSPLLWAVAGCPRLLLPAGLLARLDGDQRATLLAHELAHYYRRDHWVRCLEFAAMGLYWWLPIAWWARRELSDAEEECCDAWVVWALPNFAKAYASALVETLDFLSGAQPALPPVASGLGRLPLLRRRLTMIMRGSTQPKLTGFGFLLVVAAAALLLPLWPSWAQQQQQQPTRPADPLAQGSGDDLKRTAEELAKLKQYMDMLKEDYQRKAAQLRLAEQQAVEKAKAAANQFKGTPGSIEERLVEIEKKLDQVLGQVRDLQKQLGKQRSQGYFNDATPKYFGGTIPPPLPKAPQPPADDSQWAPLPTLNPAAPTPQGLPSPYGQGTPAPKS